MDLEQTWRQTAGSDDTLRQLLHNDDAARRATKQPMDSLRKNMLTGMVYAVLITGGGIWLLVAFPSWTVRGLLGIVLLYNLWCLADTYRLYLSIRTLPLLPLRDAIQLHSTRIRNWWRITERLSLAVYPFAAAAGFFAGGIAGSGKSASELITKPVMLWALAGSIVVLVPLCYLLARWLFNYAYGRHLARLQSLLAGLDEQ